MEAHLSFLHKFIVSPRKIGSITPSSQQLTKKMFKAFPWDNVNSIVELGAGTGTFTSYIDQHKTIACKAIIIEQDEDMRHRLEILYPDLFYGRQAENLAPILAEYQLTAADCIISGLPFAAFKAELREQILRSIYAALKPGGLFIAFQYTPQLYLHLCRQYRQVHLGFEMRNIPPAFVYYCQK